MPVMWATSGAKWQATMPGPQAISSALSAGDSFAYLVNTSREEECPGKFAKGTACLVNCSIVKVR